MKFDARLVSSGAERAMRVYLNGKLVPRAVAFDDAEGWVESYVVDADGYPVVFPKAEDPDDHEFRFERRYGTVTYDDLRHEHFRGKDSGACCS